MRGGSEVPDVQVWLWEAVRVAWMSAMAWLAVARCWREVSEWVCVSGSSGSGLWLSL